MKKKLLLAFALFTAVFTQAQQIHEPVHHVSFHQQLIDNNGDVQRHGNSRALVYRKIAYLHNNWDFGSSTWISADSAMYTYNTNAQTTGTEVYLMGPLMWMPSTKTDITYDGNGNYTNSVYQKWVNYLSTLRNFYQDNYTYDANNDNTFSAHQLWDTTANSWADNRKGIKTFDANHHTLDVISQNWNTGASTWDNNYRYVYAYNGNWQTSTFTYQTWNTGTSIWDNSYQNAYTYDANNNLTQYTRLTWNTGTMSWDNNYRYTNTFNASNQITADIGEIWNTGTSAWDNNFHYVTTYNGNGDATQTEYFTWNTTTSTWQQDSRETYTFDGNHNYTYELIEVYNTTTSVYENNSQYFYYYQSFNVADVNNLKNELGASVFPNPAKDIHLTFGVTQTAPVTINVFDAAGRMVTTQTQNATTGTNNINVEAGNIAAGNYFIQLDNRSSNQTSVLKFVKE